MVVERAVQTLSGDMAVECEILIEYVQRLEMERAWSQMGGRAGRGPASVTMDEPCDANRRQGSTGAAPAARLDSAQLLVKQRVSSMQVLQMQSPGAISRLQPSRTMDKPPTTTPTKNPTTQLKQIRPFSKVF